MIIRYIFAVLLFLVLMFYLSYLNPDNLQFRLTPGTAIPISTSLLILSSMGIGAFLVMIAVIFRDTRKGLADWREKGRLKKKEKIMELYQQGVNDLLGRKKVEALKSFEKILEWDPKHLDGGQRGKFRFYLANRPPPTLWCEGEVCLANALSLLVLHERFVSR